MGGVELMCHNRSEEGRDQHSTSVGWVDAEDAPYTVVLVRALVIVPVRQREHVATENEEEEHALARQ
jgi:hypothetical protein